MSRHQSGTCLVIKNDGIGDLIMSSGLIASLSLQYPSGLDLVICEDSSEIASMIPGVRRIIPVSRDAIRYRTRPASLRMLFPKGKGIDRRALLEMKNCEYDDAFCLRRFIRQSSLVLMRAVRARRKFCSWQFPTNSPRWMATRGSVGWHHIPGDLQVQSELTYLATFLDHATGRKIEISPHLEFGSSTNCKPEPNTIGLGIAGASSKWPVGYWVDLATSISKTGRSIALFGGLEEQPLASLIVNAVPSSTNLVGSLSWTETLEHLSRVEAFVGNDTGLSHLASLVVDKCIVIHGGGTYGRFFPWPGACNQYVICHAMGCFDCDWHCDYADTHCVDLVRAEDVFRYFLEIVENPDDTPSARNLARTDVRFRVARRYVCNKVIHRTIDSDGQLT